MYLKIHQSYRSVIALCDAELIGKKFEEGKKQLYCRGSFFKGRKVSKEEAIKILQKQIQEDATFNIVGERSIQTAMKANIISKNSIGKVDNIPFTLVLL
jgi:hypothetical protein